LLTRLLLELVGITPATSSRIGTRCITRGRRRRRWRKRAVARRRCRSTRGLYHAALRIYLDRLLNIPAARLPDERNTAANGVVTPNHLLELLDRERQVAAAASLVDEALAQEQSAAIIRVLGSAVFREDSEFHGYQTLEAGVRRFRALASTHPLAARRSLVSITR